MWFYCAQTWKTVRRRVDITWTVNITCRHTLYTLLLHTASIYSRSAIRTRILLKCAIKKIHSARLLSIVIPFGFNESQPSTMDNALTQAKHFLSSQIIFYIKVTSPVCRYHRKQLFNFFLRICFQAFTHWEGLSNRVHRTRKLMKIIVAIDKC